jgi:non-ribosomal peptide synthase protein (TIGR01720 family)
MTTEHLAAELAKLTPDQRRLLLRRLRGEPRDEAGPQPRQTDDVLLPLSAAQERFWLLDQLSPRDPAYTITFAVRMRGQLDPAALDRALATVVERHEALRTVFVDDTAGPRQLIRSNVDVHLPRLDLRSLSAAERDEAVGRHLAEHARSTFDLTGAPPLRIVLLRLSEEEHLVLVAVHHILFDAASAGVFAEELAAAYHDAVTDGPATLPEVPLQFADYCTWERNRQTGQVAEQLAYWTRQLTGAPPLSTLPSDRHRPAVAENRDGHLTFTLPAEQVAVLEELIRQERVTLYAALLTAFGVALRQAGGQDRILVGVPTGSRTHPRLRRVVGCFYNPQALRLDLAGDLTLREVLRQAHQVVGAAYAHHDIPFTDVVAAVRPARVGRHNPLFQTMLSLVESSPMAWQGGDVSFALESPPAGVTDMDLFVTMTQHPDGSLRASCLYAADVFGEETVAGTVEVFRHLIARLCAAPDQRIDEAAPHSAHVPATPQVAPEHVPHREPSNARERTLRAIWADVLRLDRVGVDDNFFHLGGDSMQAVQVVAQAVDAGLALRPEDLVRRPTIATLAAAEAAPAAVAQLSEKDGPAPVTPAQSWFLEQVAPGLTLPGHFNHVYYVALVRDVPTARLAEAVAELARRHDSLRLRLVHDSARWSQTCAVPDGAVPFESHDLSGLPPGEQDLAAAAIAARSQTGLSLDGGLVRVEHFRLRPHQPDRLLMICHHLAVDGLSRALILGDLQRILDGTGAAAPQPAPYRHWAARLAEYGRDERLTAQAPFWLAQDRRVAVPVDHEGEPLRLSSRTEVCRSLSPSQTAALRNAARRTGVGLGAVLLAAVVQSVAAWQDSADATLDVAAPGRLSPYPDLDVSRTVGWFQVFYPLRLSADPAAPLLTAAASVRHRVETVPLRGLEHGLLRHFCTDRAVREELAGMPAPQISFNYQAGLGSEYTHGGDRLFVPVDAPSGLPHDPAGEWPYLVDFVGSLDDGRLRLAVHHSPTTHDRPTIERLADGVFERLHEEDHVV